MLILQRKKGESIQIGDDITITIREISGDRVKLAIEAPVSIPVVRTELLEAMNSNKEAALVSSDLLLSLNLISPKEP